MEKDPFEKKSESSSESSSDSKSSSTKTRSTGSAAVQAGFRGESNKGREEAPAARKEPAKDLGSFLAKITGERPDSDSVTTNESAKKSAESKSEAAESATVSKVEHAAASDQGESAGLNSGEQGVDRPESDKESEDKLSQAELHVLTEEYIASEIEAAEARAEADSAERQDDQDVEMEANAALLREMQSQLANSETSVEEALAAAEAVVAEKIADSGIDDEVEQAEAPGSAVPSAESTPDDETDDQAASTVTTGAQGGATSGSGSAGGSSGSGNGSGSSTGGSGGSNVPPSSPPPLGAPGSNGPHNPNNPFYGPIYNVIQAPAAAVNQNVAPAAANMISTADSLHNERLAQARGLLVGGVVGYMIGRRGGRKRAERRLLPIQKNLERQVADLKQSISSKQEQVRSLARDKMEASHQAGEREALIARLQTKSVEAAPERIAAGTKRSPERTATTVRQREVIPNASSGELSIRGNGPRTAEVRLSARPEQTLKLRSERVASPTGEVIIPFNKNVSEYSRQELMAAAEKIKIEGTSLKEMVDLGRLDERGLRRVVREFVRGGNVERALNKETKEVDLRFEKDPIMRQQLGSLSAAAAGASLLGAAAGASNGKTTEDAKSQDKTGKDKQQGPQLSPEQLKQIRDQQMQAVTLTTVIVVIIVAVVAYLIW